MQHSPAFIAPSPSSLQVASPLGSGGRGGVGVPSPGQAMINTPGQTMQPSPSNANQEDKTYLDKVSIVNSAFFSN